MGTRRILVVSLFMGALLLSACAIGTPTAPTRIGATGATLNGTVSSNVRGPTEYWFRYGETSSYGSETPRGTIDVEDDQAHPVSEPVAGLSPDTAYHWQMCVADREEDPPRTICSKDQTLATHHMGAVKSVAAGFDHSCAILHNGSVRCWGNGYTGQLGQGNTESLGHTSGTLPDGVPPVDLGEGRTALQISSGYSHTCALLDTHQVLCWGDGAGGDLGQGDQEPIGDDETPGSVDPIDLGGDHTALQISAGLNYNCALLDDHSVKCWGSGSYGELGYGNETNVFDPSTVPPVDLGGGHTAKAIATPSSHTCAILDSGDLKCWGFNFAGTLGLGDDYAADPYVGDEEDEVPATLPTLDLGGHSALQVSGGDHHTCAVLDDHTARCWGSGWRGKNGYPGSDHYDSPPAEPLDFGSERTVLAIDGGADHNCALLDDHTVRCFGFGESGQLGYGDTEDVGDDETPGSAGPIDLGPGRTALEVSAGRWHSCALLDDGAVRCWGDGSFLGYGNLIFIGDDETPGGAGPVSLGD
jgi:alpha-tubulin suppressor-like RCC1 family protein